MTNNKQSEQEFIVQRLFDGGYEELRCTLQMDFVGTEFMIDVLLTVEAFSELEPTVILESWRIAHTPDLDVLLQWVRDQIHRTHGLLSPF